MERQLVGKVKKSYPDFSPFGTSTCKSTETLPPEQSRRLSDQKNLLSLFSSAHIINFKLDWLHFGFATIALGRENLAKVLGARMAVSIRGYDISIYPLKNPECYKLLWKCLDKLHYISDDIFSMALRHGFDNEIPHQKITPAINTSLFQGRRASSISSPVKIVTVGRLHWIKGFEYVLQALSLLDARGVDFEYTIIGDGEEYERLIFASYQLGIKERVFFVGGKTVDEVKQILQNTDIYVQYSIHEGFCNAVLEAQAMGLLSIVSDAGALPENVLHDKTGWVVSKRNPEALAEQIFEILALPEIKRSQISQAAIERVVKQFNLTKQKLEFLEFYR